MEDHLRGSSHSYFMLPVHEKFTDFHSTLDRHHLTFPSSKYSSFSYRQTETKTCILLCIPQYTMHHCNGISLSLYDHCVQYTKININWESTS